TSHCTTRARYRRCRKYRSDWAHSRRLVPALIASEWRNRATIAEKHLPTEIASAQRRREQRAPIRLPGEDDSRAGCVRRAIGNIFLHRTRKLRQPAVVDD